MDDRKAGRIVGTFLADLVFFSLVCGAGILSLSLVSKLLRIAISREAMKSVMKNDNPNNEYDNTDFE